MLWKATNRLVLASLVQTDAQAAVDKLRDETEKLRADSLLKETGLSHTKAEVSFSGDPVCGCILQLPSMKARFKVQAGFGDCTGPHRL